MAITREIAMREQAQRAERADTHQPRQYLNPVCKGSLALGNACKICERCLEELEAMKGFGDAPLVSFAESGQISLQISIGQPSDQPNPNVVTLPFIVPSKIESADITKIDGSKIKTGDFTVSGVKIQGLPVAGYKKEQPQWAVDLVNNGKALEELTLRHADQLRSWGSHIDQRDVSRAITLLEEGFSRLARAVFQPQRLSGEIEAPQTYPTPPSATELKS